MRYAGEDDFGSPETAFLVCRFCLKDAWWLLGQVEEARHMFRDAPKLGNYYGLLSEDAHPQTGALWGRLPQAYSMAGLVTSAMRLSRSREDRHWHASS
jgi:GH15 family glucan-1,4-alpha-glucosidase